MKSSKVHLLVFCVFLFLSVLMLWPLPKHLSTHLVSEVDPLLNTWILAWDVHQLTHQPFHLFDANIFFPLANTLAFSEHLIPLSLMALPVILISGNPILGYNLIHLLSFILCGYAAYLLVFHLTGHRAAGVVAGIIFAFHPFRFRQVGHIQNLAVFWTPLCLLYLHKFFQKLRWRDVLVFAVFFVLQVLSCAYMGVFLSLLVGLAVVYYFLFLPRKKYLPLVKKLVVTGLLAALIIAPFLYPYLQVRKEYQVKRGVEHNIRISANILSYATVSRFNENVFYHRISRKVRYVLHQTKKEITRPVGRGHFPGVMVLLLVLCAFVLPAPRGFRTHQEKTEPDRLYGVAEKISTSLVILSLLLMVLIVAFRGWEVTFLGLRMRITQLTVPASLFLLFSFIRLILTRFSPGLSEEKKNRSFYLFFAVLSVFLSFGPIIYFLHHSFGDGPYMFLYKHIFFFKGIRAPERFGILVMLCLSVVSGYGVSRLWDVIRKRGQPVITAGMCAVLIYEFICVPLPSVSISREPDAVYRWLASESGQYGILEYPFDTHQKNKYYMYWSTFHWKRLANGSTGYNPPLFLQLRRLAHDSEDFPNARFLEYLKTHVPVRYLILHLDGFSPAEKEDILAQVSRFPDDLSVVKRFEPDDYVFRVEYGRK